MGGVQSAGGSDDQDDCAAARALVDAPGPPDTAADALPNGDA